MILLSIGPGAELDPDDEAFALGGEPVVWIAGSEGVDPGEHPYAPRSAWAA